MTGIIALAALGLCCVVAALVTMLAVIGGGKE